MQELEYPFNPEYLIKKKKSLKRLLLESNNNFIDIRIAILGGSTTDEIKNMMELFLLNYGIRPSFYESEYNMFYEDIMFDNKELTEFSPDIIYFHTSNRNISVWPSVSDTEEEVESLIKSIYDKFELLWNKASDKYHCPIIQNNFEPPFWRMMGNRDAFDIHGKVYFVNHINEMLYSFAKSHSNFYIHDINYEAAIYGLDKWSDPYYWHMYKYSMCLSAIPYTAFDVANIIKSIYGKNKKALALDMDNTLWGGIIGDDGVDNIEIGQETSEGQVFSEFQSYLKSRKQLGILLSVVSKNDEHNALEGLRRPDSILREDDFVEIKANWDPKDINLKLIAKDINLLPESFVFVDDNPAERAIVRGNVPGCAVPELTEPEHYIQILDKAGYFEITQFSDDDLKRNAMYEANAKRLKEEASFENYEDYLVSLEMKAEIKSFEPVYMSRIAQLTNKSNQFNLTTKRYSQTDIEEVAASDKFVTLYGKLEDKFGDNGVVSVVIGNIADDILHIDLWIMSCRVLKRDMEYAMMDTLVERCQSLNLKKIVGYFYPTAKNSMVKELYSLMGFTKTHEDDSGNTTWEFDIQNDYTNKNTVIKVN